MIVANILEESRLGGPQIRLARVGEELIKHNVKTVVVSPFYNYADFKQLCEKKKLTFKAVQIQKLNKKPTQVIKFLLYFIKDIFTLYKILKKINADLVHISGGSWQIRGLIASYFLNKPIIWHLNDTFMPKVILVFFKLLKTLATGYIFASKRSFKLYRINISQPYRIIHSTIDTNYFKKTSTNKKFNFNKLNNKKIIINISNISPVKNIECLILSISLIKKKVSNVHLIIIGNTFESQLVYKKKILNMINNFDLNDNISFFEKITDVRPYLNIASLYICTSNYESSPLSVWEAMSMCLPIVSTDVGDLKEYIKNNTNGYIVKQNDFKSIAKHSIEILKNKEKFKSFGKFNRNIAVKNFSINNIALQTLDFYRSIHKKFYKLN